MNFIPATKKPREKNIYMMSYPVDLGDLPKKQIKAIEELIRTLKKGQQNKKTIVSREKPTPEHIIFRSKQLGTKNTLTREKIYDWL